MTPNQKFIDLYRTETYHKWGHLNPWTGQPRPPIIELTEEPDLPLSEQELIDSYRWQLQMSVNAMLHNAQKPAFTLSSGLDSSAVLFMADKAVNRKHDAFSVVYEGGEYDESADIKEMLGDTKDRWHPIRIAKPDVRAILKEMISIWKEPIPTVTWMSHYILCKAVAKQGFKSLFHGVGSDEINAGEYEHFPYFFADLAAPRAEIDAWIDHHRTEKYPKTPKMAFELIRQIRSENSGRPLKGFLKNKLYRGLNVETLPVCLNAIKKNTEAFGLTSYSPFLDPDLIRFMFRVPNHLKIRNGVMKWLHREAMRGILPEKTRTRTQKVGWNAPLDQWLPETVGMSDREKMLYWQKLNLDIWLS